MFAEMMHSLGDAANQFFVFIGSALSKKAPTPKFPNGFGRVVNLSLSWCRHYRGNYVL